MLEEVSLNTSANFGVLVIRNTDDKRGGEHMAPPHAGSIYANPIPFSVYYFSNFNVLMIAIGVFEGVESNEINFI